MVRLFKHGILICVFMILGKCTLSAQEPAVLLKKYSDSLRFCKTEALRYIYNDSFKVLMNDLLLEDDAFDLNLDSITTVSVLNSEDKKMRVITWFYINDKEEFTNHGVVLYRKKTKAPTKVFWLSDHLEAGTDSLYEEYGADNWPGALYYQMSSFKKKRNQYYVVLGLDGKNSFKNRKVIDVLWVDKDGELHIGAPVFYRNERDYNPQYRAMFDFADQSVMVLRFEKNGKMITYSNLVPTSPEKKGMRQYYVPDGRIDYYRLSRKGKWIRYEGLSEFDVMVGQ